MDRSGSLFALYPTLGEMPTKLLCPVLILRHRLKKACDVLLEVVHVRYQLCRRTLAGTKTNRLVGLIDGHQIDFGVRLVPEALNAMGNGKSPIPLRLRSSYRWPVSFLQGPTFDIRQPLVGFLDQFVEWSKRDCGNRIRQGRKPGTQEIVGDVIAAALRLGSCEHGQFAFDQPESFDREPSGSRQPACRGFRWPDEWLAQARCACGPDFGPRTSIPRHIALAVHAETNSRLLTGAARNSRRKCDGAASCGRRPGHSARSSRDKTSALPRRGSKETTNAAGSARRGLQGWPGSSRCRDA